ncbi:MAG: hypothetical protein WCI87_10050, partial [Euryarchaeota archaeon]
GRAARSFLRRSCQTGVDRQQIHSAGAGETETNRGFYPPQQKLLRSQIVSPVGRSIGAQSAGRMFKTSVGDISMARVLRGKAAERGTKEFCWLHRA